MGLIRRIRIRLYVRMSMAVLWFRHRLAASPVTGEAPVVVCLTSHGRRVRSVHHVVESIGRGVVRPSALIVWLDEEGLHRLPARRLARLRRRGVQVRICPDYGPHKKQYPYAASVDSHVLPLVTADDDCLYPRDWLQGLLAAHVRLPDVVQCHRARRMRLVDGEIAPYVTWPAAREVAANFGHVAVGVGGTLYPPALLDALAARGTTFLARCRNADDLWVHATAVAGGVRTRQVAPEPLELPSLPYSQRRNLLAGNVLGGGNDEVVAHLYPVEARRLIAFDLGEPA